MQLFSPFTDKWFHHDALFIIDVWMLTGLSLAIWLSRRRERSGGNWQRPAVAGLGVLLVYIAGNGGLSALAKDAPRLAAPEVIYASPPPVLFWRRELAWRQAREVRWGSYDPFRSLSQLVELTAPVPDNLADPLVRRALLAPGMSRFARWSTMPIAQVDRGRCRARVSFGDARYGRSVRENRFRQGVELPTGGPGC